MFHRRNTFLGKIGCKNLVSWVYARYMIFWILLRYRSMQRHHKIALGLTGMSIFFIGFLMVIQGISGDAVFAQIRFQIAIRSTIACQNGIDDDMDGLIDFPEDPGCTSASDTTENTLLTGICYPLVNSATVGQSVTWVASADNGDPPYIYNWSGRDGLTGSISPLQKTYGTPGKKTATVIITSGGVSSLPIPCESSVIISPVHPSNGGGGGEGGSNADPSASPKKDTAPLLDTAQSKDTKKIENNTSQSDTDAHPECFIPEYPTFKQAKDYLVCDNIITPREREAEYEYSRPAYRKELLGIANTIHLKHSSVQEKVQLSKLSLDISDAPRSSFNHSYHFLDIGLVGQPIWISQTVENGVVFGLISNKNTYFRPDDNSTRAESFAMLMRSVCMDPDQSTQKNWHQRVYEIAFNNGITSRSWQNFAPNAPILRQEIFLMTARLDRWKDTTGGCDRDIKNTTTSPSKKDTTIIADNNSLPSCFLPEKPTPEEAEKYLICDNLLTAPQLQEKYDAHIQRIKVLGLGLEVFFKHRVIQENLYQTPFTLQYLDIGIPGQEPWIEAIATQGVRYGLIKNKNIDLRPNDYVTRGEALSLLIRSVCMNESIQPTQPETLYEIAKKNGITQLSQEDFDVNALIDRGELFIAVSKLDRWKEVTGGCDTYPDLLPKYTEALTLESAPKEPEKTMQNSPSNTQKPGTFSLLFEDESQKMYAYIVKNGGIPDGVRLQYLRIFSGNKSIAARIKIHDISGVEYPEDRWLLGGEVVYITLKK